jgi:hypothetical protein
VAKIRNEPIRTIDKRIPVFLVLTKDHFVAQAFARIDRIFLMPPKQSGQPAHEIGGGADLVHSSLSTPGSSSVMDTDCSRYLP